MVEPEIPLVPSRRVAAILTRESASESVRQFGAQVTHGLRLSSIYCGTLSVKDLLARRVRWVLTTMDARF